MKPAFFQRGNQHRERDAIFGTSCLGLDLDQSRKIEHPDRQTAVRQNFRVRKQLVVSLPVTQLAKRVERTQAGRQIDLTAAEQQGGRRPKAAIGKIVPHDGIEPTQHVHEPCHVLLGSAMDDIEILRRDGRGMQDRRGTAHDDEFHSIGQEFSE